MCRSLGERENEQEAVGEGWRERERVIDDL